LQPLKGKSGIRLGWWRSPVAHLHGVQGVAGSNPVHPTYIKINALKACKKSLIYKLFYFFPYQIVAKNIKGRANKKVNWNVNYLPVRKFDLVILLSVDYKDCTSDFSIFHSFIFRVSRE
jgi:hypothetical protein